MNSSNPLSPSSGHQPKPNETRRLVVLVGALAVGLGAIAVGAISYGSSHQVQSSVELGADTETEAVLFQADEPQEEHSETAQLKAERVDDQLKSEGSNPLQEEILSLQRAGNLAEALRRLDATSGGKDAALEEWAMSSKINVLIGMAKIGNSRDLAALFYEKFPNSPEIQRIQSRTGMHLPPKRGPAQE